ncbi:TEX47 protein, partial [Bucorvus abyssinicus]|nr:TEX47 protein [Bucorvus abyssinicus]
MSEQAPARARPASPEPAALERQSLLALGEPASPSPLVSPPQRRFPLHRLLVVARPGEGAAAAEVAGYHSGLFEKAVEDQATEQVSGLLLLSPSWILHVVESCSSTIHLIIQDLASLQNQGQSALLLEIKVLVVAHNITTRLFPDWYVATAMSPVAHPPDSTRSQSTAEAVTECLTLLRQVAVSIQSFEDDSEDMSEAVHTAAPELLMPAETIDYLFNAEECASPDDFLRTYFSPSQAALDSGAV